MNDRDHDRYDTLDASAFLMRAMKSNNPRDRKECARLGLEQLEGIESDIDVLLYRQAYLAHLELGELDAARACAESMIETGHLLDLGYHDLSRVQSANGDLEGAIASQRHAARVTEPTRRSFHQFALSVLLELAGDLQAAVAAARRGLRWAGRDRSLVAGYEALLRLRLGETVSDLSAIIENLRKAPAAKGYGGYVLGRIAHEIGDHDRALVYLRAFLRRHASATGALLLSLREEIRSARRIVASSSS